MLIETSDVTLTAKDAGSGAKVPPGDYAVLSVSDTGIGMSEEVKSRVFEPFFTTKDVGKGTGLGLSTCYAIVSQSGGHIAVESEPGQGTAFNVYIPRVKEASDHTPPSDESVGSTSGSETLLLVEDEPSVRRVALKVLTDRGYSVLEAGNGDEALHAIRSLDEENIHLLVTDVVMPVMGGVQLAQNLREAHPETKVLYTSGHVGEEVVKQEVMLSDNEFIQKPFTPESLAAKVREVLDR